MFDEVLLTPGICSAVAAAATSVCATFVTNETSERRAKSGPRRTVLLVHALLSRFLALSSPPPSILPLCRRAVSRPLSVRRQIHSSPKRSIRENDAIVADSRCKYGRSRRAEIYFPTSLLVCHSERAARMKADHVGNVKEITSLRPSLGHFPRTGCL